MNNKGCVKYKRNKDIRKSNLPRWIFESSRSTSKHVYTTCRLSTTGELAVFISPVNISI